MKNVSVIVIGAGGHGSEIVSYIRDLASMERRVHVAGFVDEGKPQGLLCGTKVLGDFMGLRTLLRRHPSRTHYYITAAGDNAIRLGLVQKIEKLKARNLLPWTLLHPGAAIGHEVTIGEGTCLTPGSIVTTRSTIGQHCIVNVNVSVSHDCHIGDFVNINPGAVICGNVTIGQGCSIGAGATVIDKVSIGPWTVIGAGAVVVEDLPADVTAVGVPARIIKRHPPMRK